MYVLNLYKLLNKVIGRSSLGTKPLSPSPNSKQQYHNGTWNSLGPMPHSPGRMPFVTKEVQVRYLYGMGWMSSVTNYIKILISLLINLVWSCGLSVIRHSSSIYAEQPGPRHPFGAWRSIIVAVDPEKFLTILGIKNILTYNSVRISRVEIDTNRGDDRLHGGGLSSPR